MADTKPWYPHVGAGLDAFSYIYNAEILKAVVVVVDEMENAGVSATYADAEAKAKLRFGNAIWESMAKRLREAGCPEAEILSELKRIIRRAEVLAAQPVPDLEGKTDEELAQLIKDETEKLKR